MSILKLASSDDQASLILSIVISCSAFTQVVVGISSGFLAKRYSMKYVIFVLQLIGMVGILVYAFSGWPIGSAWGIVIGRSICGANTGIQNFLYILSKRWILIVNFHFSCCWTFIGICFNYCKRSS